MLESAIGNHDQVFLDNWFSKLKQFTLSLMKDIFQLCDKNIAKSTSEINKTEVSLKSNANQEQLWAIMSKIQSNETAAKKILQQHKFKKFSNLKHKLENAI